MAADKFYKGKRVHRRASLAHASRSRVLLSLTPSRARAGMMDGVRTVASPELSEDAVEAARARRRRSNTDERGVEEELGATKVPSNHPWASSKQKLTKEVR